ncbi:hypothetical protein PpBr36_03675 [Pyricularia pennisetigena]|uniref:hypothetical protein n=1 Tax=Pyricularia pennisetigena TaxID=1578925 RepID=UPI00114F13EE|nr:hypothetical protein PpBr36_03675 [Pyricularia pennisetigena]TLS30521.1 hypothetical protein PpBr36_03675 [Pyricularia pennisetigena]
MASNPQLARPNGAPTAAPVSAGDDTWDETKYEASLKHLHELHLQASGKEPSHQLRRLRATIPRMIAPATENIANPAELFPALQQSMASGVKDVKDFKDSMTSRETSKIISRAVQSRQKNPLGIKPWRPKDDPNWTQMDLD